MLYRSHSSAAYGLALRVTRDEHLAQDVLQESFADLWAQASRFDPRISSVRSWITMLTHRRAVDRVRREQCDRDRVSRWATATPSRDHDSVAEVVELRAEHRRVRQAMDGPHPAAARIPRAGLPRRPDAHRGGRTTRHPARHRQDPDPRRPAIRCAPSWRATCERHPRPPGRLLHRLPRRRTSEPRSSSTWPGLRRMPDEAADFREVLAALADADPCAPPGSLEDAWWQLPGPRDTRTPSATGSASTEPISPRRRSDPAHSGSRPSATVGPGLAPRRPVDGSRRRWRRALRRRAWASGGSRPRRPSVARDGGHGRRGGGRLRRPTRTCCPWTSWAPRPGW